MKDLREKLLAFCDEALKRQTLSGDSYGRKGVSAGLHAARAVIEQVASVEDADRYLADVRAALEAERAKLDRPDDDDGYALGGLATVRAEVERLQKKRKSWF